MKRADKQTQGEVGTHIHTQTDTHTHMHTYTHKHLTRVEEAADKYTDINGLKL